jgi:hypothetical protein
MYYLLPYVLMFLNSIHSELVLRIMGSVLLILPATLDSGAYSAPRSRKMFLESR